MAILNTTAIHGDSKILGDVNTKNTSFYGNTFIKNDENLTKNTPINVNLESQKIHIRIKILQFGDTWTDVPYEGYCGQFMYLGVPEGFDIEDVDLFYVKYSTTKNRGKYYSENEDRLVRRMTKIHRGWHGIKNPNDHVNLDNYNLISFRFDFTISHEPVFSENGYDYRKIEGKCYDNGGVETWITDMVEYASLPVESNPEEYNFYLPTGYGGIIKNPETGEDEFVDIPVGMLLNNRKAGICLRRNGKIISDVAIIRWVRDTSIWSSK